MGASLGQSRLIKFLSPVKFSHIFVTLDQDVQKFQVLRLPEMSLLQFLHRQF